MFNKKNDVFHVLAYYFIELRIKCLCMYLDVLTIACISFLIGVGASYLFHFIKIYMNES